MARTSAVGPPGRVATPTRRHGDAGDVRAEVRERRLLRAARRGDRGARGRLVATRLDLVRSIAARYRDLGLSFDDLIQEGAIGLLEAIDRYDSGRGPSFDAYARFRIRRAIRNALTEQARVIRLPKQMVERRRAIGRAEARLRAAGDRPTTVELADATGLSLRAVAEARAATTASLSLDASTLRDGETPAALVADPASSDPETEAIDREQAARVREAVDHLSPRKRRIVAAQWGLGGTARTSTRQLAAELGLSTRRTQAIGRDALRELGDLIEGREPAIPTPRGPPRGSRRTRRRPTRRAGDTPSASRPPARSRTVRRAPSRAR